MSAVQIQSEVPFSLLKLLQVSTIVLLAFSQTTSESNWNGSLDKAKTIHAVQNLAPSPLFDDIMIRQVDARPGQTVLLPCTIRNLRDKVVSWIRSKDLHILTSERHTFSSDTRFEPVHSSASGDFWGLRIRGVHVSDTGQYECQVNTDPKISLAIKLTVAEPGVGFGSKWVSQALVKGPRQVYVQNGSPVTFTCEISPLSVASLHLDSLSGSSVHGLFFAGKPRVRWLHDGKEISFEENRVGLRIDTDYRDMDLRISSKIYLSGVTWRDSGQYTCMQPSTKPDSVNLTVVEGEHSEAMQRDFPIVSSKASNFCYNYINFCLSFTHYYLTLYSILF